MIKKQCLKLTVFIAAMLYSCFAHSSEKIYYLDIDFLMNNSLAGKSIVEQLNKKNKLNQETFIRTEKALKAEESKLISQKKLLNKEEFDKKAKLFSKKVSDYNSKRKNLF